MKKKRRRLRKLIRAAIKGATYLVTASAVDLAVISTCLYWFGNIQWTDVQWAAVIGTCLLLNIGLEYLFFRREFRKTQ